MPTILKNPILADYFKVIQDIRIDTPPEEIPSYIEEYEAGNVLSFPNLRPKIDFDFWAALPADDIPSLKKMMLHVDPTRQDVLFDNAMRKADVPQELRDGLISNMRDLISQIMPIYNRIFAGYQFSARRAVWRLNTIHAENLHFDTYREAFPEHFARMFINLDNQPRIWHTSYHVQEIFDRFRGKIPDEKLHAADINRFWREMQLATFGSTRAFDNEPRHIAFFDPGDVWVVDSRQIAHQIFYGRRALSIDFEVTIDSMKDRTKHYMHMSETFRDALVQERQSAVA